MEKAVEVLENKMRKTGERMDTLVIQVGSIESEIFTEDGQEIEMNNLLKTVNEVQTNYESLRKDLMEVQDLQRQLSTTLSVQLKLMQAKFNLLKEKLPHAPTTLRRGHDRLGEDM